MNRRRTEKVTRAESEFLRLRSIFAYKHELYDEIQADLGTAEALRDRC